MIQTEIRDDRNEVVKLDHNDPRYWEGAYRYEPFPKALYRVTQPGQAEPEMIIVKHQQDMDKLSSDWKESPADAKAYFERLEADVAKAAATANYEDRNMGEKAQTERLAHERSTDEMVTAVPEARKRPGRPRKAASAPIVSA